MESLLELNKQALFARLKSVQRINELYVANDIIDVLSSQKNTDKTLLNSYNEDEIRVNKIYRESGTRLVRMLTKKGVERYLLEGKVLDYKNACEYFNIKPVDKLAFKYNKEFSSKY